MPLTLNQFLLLVLTLAAAVCATVLVVFFLQLRRTAREGEKTLRELRELVRGLKATNESLRLRLEESGEVFRSAKKAAGGAAEAAGVITAKLLRPSSKYWPFVFPLMKWGWRQIRKRKNYKEESNGE